MKVSKAKLAPDMMRRRYSRWTHLALAAMIGSGAGMASGVAAQDAGTVDAGPPPPPPIVTRSMKKQALEKAAAAVGGAAPAVATAPALPASGMPPSSPQAAQPAARAGDPK